MAEGLLTFETFESEENKSLKDVKLGLERDGRLEDVRIVGTNKRSPFFYLYVVGEASLLTCDNSASVRRCLVSLQQAIGVWCHY